MGGHEATITAVCFMRDRPYDTIPSVITACYDCSLRTWNMDEGFTITLPYIDVS